MENDHPQPTQRPSPDSTAGLEERVREIQKRAERAGFGTRGVASPEADKAFMDELWGED